MGIRKVSRHISMETGWHVPDDYLDNMDLATASIVKVDNTLIVPARYEKLVGVRDPWKGISIMQLTFGELVYKANKKSVDWEKVRENRG